MKIYGYPDSGLPIEEVIPDSLAEITLVASPSELRRIAEFLVNGAAAMEGMGSTYSHEHLSDWDHSFESSPHFVIAPPAVDIASFSLSPIEKEVLNSIVIDYESSFTIIGEAFQSLGQAVSEPEIAAALVSLTSYGLAEAYIYDPALGDYRCVSLAEAGQNADLWFLATAAGRAANDKLDG